MSPASLDLEHHTSLREEEHLIKNPVFPDPSVLVQRCSCGADRLTAAHNSSMGSVVRSHIPLS